MEKTNLTFISKWLLIIYKKLALYIFINYIYLLFPVMFSCSKISITIFYIHLYVYLFVCVCASIHLCHACIWRSEDNVRESVFSFHHMSS